MKFLIMLEPTSAGFAVQVPDLAITTHGETIEAAKQAAIDAIAINLDAYREVGQEIPTPRSVARHLENPDFRDLLFALVELPEPKRRAA